MANFGFANLVVVAPYAPHWREARSAVGAPGLLQSATETTSLSEAIQRCTLVVGTGTLTHRKPEQPVISLPSLPELARRELANNGRIALVFGPEKHGLTREDLSYCHHLVEIPTDANQPSMNLGQAVAVCLYELAVRVPEAGLDQVPSLPEHIRTSETTAGNLDILAGLVEDVMTEAEYSPHNMQAATRHNIRLMLRRLHMNSADSRRVLGLFRRILRRIRLS
jgi:tRNA/rRNA methyltransferase